MTFAVRTIAFIAFTTARWTAAIKKYKVRP